MAEPKEVLLSAKDRERPSERGSGDTTATPSTQSHDAEDFHVFLAHNSYHKSKIEFVARELRRRGLRPWLDKEQIPPGRWFQDIIQSGIRESRSAAIFIGRKGVGRWQAIEIQSFVSRCVEENIPVIPVLLPGIKSFPQELYFLKQLTYVRFVRRIDETAALDLLEWAIKGRR